MIAAVHPSPARQTSTDWRARSASSLSRLGPVSALAFEPEETIDAQERCAEFVSEVILGVMQTDGIAACVTAAQLILASAAVARC